MTSPKHWPGLRWGDFIIAQSRQLSRGGGPLASATCTGELWQGFLRGFAGPYHLHFKLPGNWADNTGFVVGGILPQVLSPFVHVCLTVLQHAIDKSGESVSHGSDGLWLAWYANGGTEHLRLRTVLAACRSTVAARLTTRRVLLPSTLSPLLRLSGHSPQPGGEV